MLAVRKAYKAFGRGTFELLRPGNRTILAYLRRYENQTILCVANLKRSAQAVELDLAEFRGRVPVELLGRSSFPPIGELPYMLTLRGPRVLLVRARGIRAAAELARGAARRPRRSRGSCCSTGSTASTSKPRASGAPPRSGSSRSSKREWCRAISTGSAGSRARSAAPPTVTIDEHRPLASRSRQLGCSRSPPRSFPRGDAAGVLPAARARLGRRARRARTPRMRLPECASAPRTGLLFDAFARRRLRA